MVPVRVKEAEGGRHGLRCLSVQLSSHTCRDSTAPGLSNLTAHSPLAVSLGLAHGSYPHGADCVEKESCHKQVKEANTLGSCDEDD